MNETTSESPASHPRSETATAAERSRIVAAIQRGDAFGHEVVRYCCGLDLEDHERRFARAGDQFRVLPFPRPAVQRPTLVDAGTTPAGLAWIEANVAALLGLDRGAQWRREGQTRAAGPKTDNPYPGLNNVRIEAGYKIEAEAMRALDFEPVPRDNAAPLMPAERSWRPAVGEAGERALAHELAVDGFAVQRQALRLLLPGAAHAVFEWRSSDDFFLVFSHALDADGERAYEAGAPELRGVDADLQRVAAELGDALGMGDDELGIDLRLPNDEHLREEVTAWSRDELFGDHLGEDAYLLVQRVGGGDAFAAELEALVTDYDERCFEPANRWNAAAFAFVDWDHIAAAVRDPRNWGEDFIAAMEPMRREQVRRREAERVRALDDHELVREFRAAGARASACVDGSPAHMLGLMAQRFERLDADERAEAAAALDIYATLAAERHRRTLRELWPEAERVDFVAERFNENADGSGGEIVLVFGRVVFRLGSEQPINFDELEDHGVLPKDRIENDLTAVYAGALVEGDGHTLWLS